MKLLKITLISFFIVFLMGALPLFAETQSIKIGVIDLKKIVKESIYGKTVMQKLQKKYEQLSKKNKRKNKRT